MDKLLVDREYVNEYQKYPSVTISSLVDEVRFFRGLYRDSEKQTREKEFVSSEQDATHPTERIKAISILVSQEAVEDPGVKLFRSEVLSDKLLSWEKYGEMDL